MDFLVLYTMRTLAMTGLKAKKRPSLRRVLDVWSESIAGASRKVNLIAQVPVDRVPDPDVEDQGQVLVDGVLRCVLKQPNPNPVS